MLDPIYLTGPGDTPAQQQAVQALAELLNNFGFWVRSPHHGPASAEANASPVALPQEIRKAIEECLVVVATVDPNANGHPLVQAELTHAHTQHLRIIAVNLAGDSVALLPTPAGYEYARVIALPDELDDIVHPMISAINLFAHRLG